MKSPALLLLALSALSASAARGADSAPAGPPDPIDLKGAIVYALDHNYAIREAREQIRQQEGVILQVEGPAIPNLAASANYQRNEQTVSGFFPQTSNWAAELKVTQTLFAGGGIQASVRDAKLVRDAALFDLQTTVDAALLGVRTAFYSVVLTGDKVRVQQENVELFHSQLRDTENRFRAGSVSNFEVLRAKVALANARPGLITARNDYRIAIEQLRQSLGAPAGRGAEGFPRVVGDLDAAPEDVELDAALASARDRRPELLRLDRLADAGQEAVRGARAGYFPDVGLFGGYEWGGLGLAQGDDVNLHGWLFGVQSSWAIFDGRATAGRVAQATSELRQVALQRAEEELAIEVEVRQAYSAIEEARELVAASRQTIDQAQDALRLADNRFRAGTATQLDVQTSQVALTQARTDQLQANYNYLVAAATLRKAMGLGDALVGP